MRVLITGVSGFAGPPVARALADRGHVVHGLARHAPDADRIAGIPLGFHDGDVCDGPRLRTLVDEIAPDGVVHLAAVAEPAAAEADPDAAYRVNLQGTLSILAAARAAARPPRLLIVSSAAVYGDVGGQDVPIVEETPLRPVTVYGATKAAAELAALQWGHAYGLDVVVARPFNHTGPGQTRSYVCAALASQVAAIEAGRQAPVLGVGNVDPVRDVADVRDVAAGYAALLERGHAGRAYNLCSGEGVSIAEIIAQLRTLARVPMRVTSAPERRRTREIERLVGSHARASADTGWRPQNPLLETLATVLADWRRRTG